MINTTLCYIEKDNKYLMLHRNKKEKDLNAQKWIGVGGKFEPGETVEECLKREVYEETGLTLTGFVYVGMIKFVSDIYEDEDMYLFKGTSFIGEPKADCDEGTLCWVDADEVLNLSTWEGDRYFLKPLLEGRTNLNMTVRYEGDRLVDFADESREAEIETSRLITSPHGFSTRIGGISDGPYASLNLGPNLGDVRERVAENWRRFLAACGVASGPVVCGRQVHGNHVMAVTGAEAQDINAWKDWPEADGYVTKEKGLPIAIRTADCVPVLLEDYENGVIGAVHCGWRSTVADIEKNAIEEMVKLGASASNIRIAIGPAIDKCCFEVGQEVVDGLADLLGKNVADDFVTAKSLSKYMVDLRGAVTCRFVQLGIPEENIERVGDCTLCHPERYYSHRYSKGVRGSLACVIAM